MIKAIAQIVGFFGFAFAVASFQKKERNGILLFQMLANAAFTIHFGMLGAYTGAIFNFISVLRSALFSQRGKRKWADSPLWVAVFCAASITAVVLTWDGLICIFPMMGMILTTFSFYMTDAKLVRILTLPNSPLWMIYNVANRSISGICTESFIMLSIIIGMLRFDRKKSQTIEQERK